MIKQKIAGMIFIACGIISALSERDITAGSIRAGIHSSSRTYAAVIRRKKGRK
jgi:hypothetical protein